MSAHRGQSFGKDRVSARGWVSALRPLVGLWVFGWLRMSGEIQFYTMIQVTYCGSAIDPLLNGRRCRQAAFLATILLCVWQLSWGQTAAVPQEQDTPALTGPLERADTGIKLHILYVHGMGIDTPKHRYGTQDFEVSQEFRTNLCKLIGCTTKMGQLRGRDYADEADFDPNIGPPHLLYPAKYPAEYPEDYLWKNNEEWRAAAPFVDHYELVRKSGITIYVDEINWWPLILAAKCRQIVAAEVRLVDRDERHIATCAAKTSQDSNRKERYTSYAWISNPNDLRHDSSWPKPALVNRWLKHDILDWGFADALLAVGPMRQYLIEGIRETVMHSFDEADNNQEFVVVSHSLGSYLMFSALDLRDDPQAVAAHSKWQPRFHTILGETSHAYFMANQVRLLELANLDDTKNGNLITHLKNWNDARQQVHQPSPQILAWSDPDDLLTWKVPDQDVKEANGEQVTVLNRPAQNAWRWFWLLESPSGAHTKYDQNKSVLRAMVPKPNSHRTRKVNGTNAAAPDS